MSKLRLGLLAGALLGKLAIEGAVGQAPNPGTYSAATYELHERRGVMVPMRDGVRLSADIYSPKSSERLPAILSITPYGKTFFMSHPRSDARWFAKRGYIFVLVDCRGRYDSDGTWDPFDAKHKTDGYDLVEWVAQQPWSSGKVGMIGMSYNAWTQWWTASTAPPHLAAIVPAAPPSDPFENGIPYLHGALMGGILDWPAAMSGRTNQSPPASDGSWNLEDLKHTPYIDINAIRGMESALWFTTWFRQNKSTDSYWQGIAYQGGQRYSRVTVPSLGFAGWFDGTHAAPMNYVGMKKFGATIQARRPSLIIGPWTHELNQRVVGGIDYGPQATLDMEGYTARWLDHYLKGVDNGVEKDAPVYVFVMGENQWHGEQDWPLPQTQYTKYYLSSGGHANSLKGDGTLTTTPPARESSDTYSYDPRNPTLAPAPRVGDWRLGGPLDTRLSAIGDDVLVYQTAALDAPVEVTGPIEATLYASTSARDTDWMVRLVDVQPDGRALLLADGVMRARSRDPVNEGRFSSAQLSTIDPGTIYQYTIRFSRGTGNLFLRGHRIRVEISSSWYPFVLPNLNTGADNLALVSISEAVVAHQTVHHGRLYPSHILLPVIPKRVDAR